MRLSVGAGVGAGEAAPSTVMVTDCVVLPPSPAQVSVNVLVVISVPVDFEPDGGFEPVHAPEAWHDVASVDDHVSIDCPPAATLAGSALSVNVGSLAGIGHALSSSAPSPHSAGKVKLRIGLRRGAISTILQREDDAVVRTVVIGAGKTGSGIIEPSTHHAVPPSG